MKHTGFENVAIIKGKKIYKSVKYNDL